MNTFKKYRVVIFVLVPIILLVLIRLYSPGHFKPDAKSRAELSFSGENLITIKKLEEKNEKFLIINLGDKSIQFEKADNILTVTPDSILKKEIINRIRKHKGSIAISSPDISISSGIWMILSQMGIDNLYILTSDDSAEELKYKFRPDSTVRPEL
jgi:hypothetical protein